MSGWLQDRDGNPDVVLLIMLLVGVSGIVTVIFALGEAGFSISRLHERQGDAVATANGISAVLTATGGFIQNVLVGVSAFGAAVAGYQWTDAANKRAYTPPTQQPAVPVAKTTTTTETTMQPTEGQR